MIKVLILFIQLLVATLKFSAMRIVKDVYIQPKGLRIPSLNHSLALL
jgi:hypothetical protein